MSDENVHDEITGAIAKPRDSDLTVKARRAVGGTVARVGGGLAVAAVLALFASRKKRGTSDQV